MFKNKPIQTKLMLLILTISGVVLMLTCIGFFIFEYYSFRKTTVYQLTQISRMIATNSTAALAFDNTADAAEILSSLQVEPNILAAAIYDEDGNIFAEFRRSGVLESIPGSYHGTEGFNFSGATIQGYQPILYEGERLGTLYLVSDINTVYERFGLYGLIAGTVVAISLLVAFVLSKRLQRSLTRPILDLAVTARSVSENANYSVRARKYDNDEIGLLTDAFNQMLQRIEAQNLEITSFTQSLEAKVKDRTRELEAAYNEMESFSYTVSHDLNAPLRHINAYMERFLSSNAGNLNKDDLKTLNAVIRNSKKMRQLIDDLLAFSQIGRKELERKPVHMNSIVNTIVQEYRKDEAYKKVKFHIDRLPDVDADPVTIRQVWENLVSNAVKYSMQKEHPLIRISADEQAEKIVYCIEDNGAGFDMADYDRLFKVFQRLHTQREFEGTGVGLAIVERIVSRHGGRVWATGHVNQGSTFYFSLPKRIPSLEIELRK